MVNITCIDPHSSDSVFRYCPSFPASIIAFIVFGIISLIHIVLFFWLKKKFVWVITMAALWECAGFLFRADNIAKPTNDTLALISTLFIFLAPLWVNGFCYMLVGRMSYYWLPDKRVWKLKARNFGKFFVWADVISFLIQAFGASLLSSKKASTANSGKNIYLGGLVVQEIFILCFITLTILFHRRVKAVGIQRQTPWRPMLFATYFALSMITLRIIYHLIADTSGIWSYLNTHEWSFYAFDALTMALAIGTFIFVHPGNVLIGPDSEFSKLRVTKGKGRWWLCGRRSRQKVDPDFELIGNNDGGYYGQGSYNLEGVEGNTNWR